MRTIYLIIATLLLTILQTKAQDVLYGIPYNAETNKFTFDTIVEVPDASAETIFTRGKEWLATEFRDSKTLYENEDENRLALAAYSPIKYRTWFLFFFNTKEFNLLYTLKFAAKDGRYRLTISDYIIQEPLDGKISGANWAVYDDFGLSSYSIKPADSKDHPAERFFKSPHRRTERKLAFHQFQEINREILKKSAENIQSHSKRDNW
jgi:hypothetical protein